MSEKKNLRKRLVFLRSQADNTVCVDCGVAISFELVSIFRRPPGSSDVIQHLGAFACEKCSDVHLSLGNDVCFVKNMSRDSFEEKHVTALERGGNKRINRIYEKGLYSQNLVSKLEPEAHSLERKGYIVQKYVRRVFYDKAVHEEECRVKPVEYSFTDFTFGTSFANLVNMDISSLSGATDESKQQNGDKEERHGQSFLKGRSTEECLALMAMETSKSEDPKPKYAGLYSGQDIPKAEDDGQQKISSSSLEQTAGSEGELESEAKGNASPPRRITRRRSSAVSQIARRRSSSMARTQARRTTSGDSKSAEKSKDISLDVVLRDGSADSTVSGDTDKCVKEERRNSDKLITITEDSQLARRGRSHGVNHQKLRTMSNDAPLDDALVQLRESLLRSKEKQDAKKGEGRSRSKSATRRGLLSRQSSSPLLLSSSMFSAEALGSIDPSSALTMKETRRTARRNSMTGTPGAEPGSPVTMKETRKQTRRSSMNGSFSADPNSPLTMKETRIARTSSTGSSGADPSSSLTMKETRKTSRRTSMGGGRNLRMDYMRASSARVLVRKAKGGENSLDHRSDHNVSNRKGSRGRDGSLSRNGQKRKGHRSRSKGKKAIQTESTKEKRERIREELSNDVRPLSAIGISRIANSEALVVLIQ